MANDGLYKRGQIWWCRYVDASGRTRRRSTRTRDKTVARQRKREFELERAADRAAHVTLGRAMTHLLDTVYAGRRAATVASYRQKARHLVRVLGADTPLGDIDRARCHEYRATRLKEGAHPHSIHKEAVVLRLALREQGIEGVVPRWRAEYTPRDRHLSLAEFRGVLAALPAKRRLWLMLATYLGLRDSELNRLRWEDVHLDKRVVRVRGTKTERSDRLVAIPPPLVPWLEAERRDSGPVVATWTNRRRDITAAYWRVIGYEPGPKWSKGVARGGGSIAGAPRISPNDLRRTFASWLKQQGADSMAVARLLGHGSTRMVETVYGRLRAEDLDRVVSLLPAPGSVPDLYRQGGHSRPLTAPPDHDEDA